MLSPRERDGGLALVTRVREARPDRVDLDEPPAPALGTESRFFTLLLEFSFS